jgi:hypothetical protein
MGLLWKTWVHCNMRICSLIHIIPIKEEWFYAYSWEWEGCYTYTCILIRFLVFSREYWKI